jgi:superfamily I DNA/RNA helicase
VPSEWLADVRQATEDTLLDLTGHLPAEAAEALLNLATGTTPPLRRRAAAPHDRRREWHRRRAARHRLCPLRPAPSVMLFADAEEEVAAISRWLADWLAEGIRPEEIGLLVRAPPQLARARAAAKRAEADCFELSEKVKTMEGCVAIAIMHLAQGLEFRAVAVLACDEEVLPLQERIEEVADEADQEDTYDTERHLLYVACTRARENLPVTVIRPGSEFLADLGAS